MPIAPSAADPGLHRTSRALKRLARRRRSDRLFAACGPLAVVIAAGMLAWLLGSVLLAGLPAFVQSRLALEVDLPAAPVTDFRMAVQQAVAALDPPVEGRSERVARRRLVSDMAEEELRARLAGDPALAGTRVALTVTLSDEADQYLKHVPRNAPADAAVAGISPGQRATLDAWRDAGRISTGFAWTLLGRSDSREPEQAGVLGALVGTLLTMLVTLAVCAPIGIAAALYLEEFARPSRWTAVAEVAIANLAAVPSIVFGLLGLAVFIGWFGLPRSAPLVGGLVLGLMNFPLIVIAARAALRAVPAGLREAAMGMGASRVQTVFGTVLPVALPGIVSGATIAMAHALGETAPLLMIGMVAFVVDVPHGLGDAATTLPVQIFLWSDSPERAFAERSSAAILVLLAVLLGTIGAASALRRRFERHGQ